MSKRSIFVVGQGFVGGSLSVGMCHAFDVLTFDKSGKVADSGGRGLIHPAQTYYDTGLVTLEKLVEHVEEHVKSFTKVYFVAVPTPMRKDGSADLRIVESVLDQLASVPGDRIAVVKSTVPPGSTELWNKKYESTGLRVVFNPEFLTEANALSDFMNQNRIVLGGPRPQINKVKEIFQTAFPNVPIIKTSSTTAELVKYTINCFLATKVAFANELYDICTRLDSSGLNVDYDKVVEYSKYDDRVGKSHWAVPGPVSVDGEQVRGFGGHCFPKDINALMFVAKSLGVEPHVMNGAWEKNLEVRPPEHRDWELQEGRAVSKD